MTRFRNRLRSFAWIAIVAMAALAFGPTISRTLGAEAMADGAMHTHCMAVGSPDAMPMSMPMSMSMSAGKQADPADGPAAPRHPSNLLDCCALCAIAASPMATVSFAMPPWQRTEIAVPAPGGIVDAQPPQRLQWPSAAPRGPPFLS